MNWLPESLLIIVTTPVYLIVIGLEVIASNVHHFRLYSVKGVLTNTYLMLLNMGIDLLFRGFTLALLDAAYKHAFLHVEYPLLYWFTLLMTQDLMYYLLHLVDHKVRLFWAVHVTHHSSDEFNLTVGFRSSVFQPLYRVFYFIPLALVGFHSADILLIYSITQIYGILVHTQLVNKMGFLEHIMVTPSHHRVHHASNVKYLDRNMGMVFIFWDKIFGTFTAEDPADEISYGLTKPIENPGPVNTVFHEFRQMAADLQQPDLDFNAKCNYVFGPPGWSHDGSRKTSDQLRSELYGAQPSNFSKLSSVPSKTA